MSLDALGITGLVNKTLLIDGDIIVYQTCCIFNDDDDLSRRQIARNISNKIDKIMEAADCNTFMFFLTTKFNFRDDLVSDYKANRLDIDRPVNLSWAKRFTIQKFNAHFVKGLEADDLIGIYYKENCVIWSLDKDLRQIPGEHLDDETQKVITITQEGKLVEKKWVTETGNKRSKIMFEGTIGLYFQMLTGDSTDYILGCAKRLDTVIKSGPKIGTTKLKRVGVGPKAAYNGIIKTILQNSNMSAEKAVLMYVVEQYKAIWGSSWKVNLETQANLLYMVRMKRGDVFRRWTVDGRKEYFHLIEGKILTEEVYINDYSKTTE